MLKDLHPTVANRARHKRSGARSRFRLNRLSSVVIASLIGFPAVGTILATSQPAAAVANAVVPDSAIGGFTPIQFTGNDDGTYPCGGAGNAPPACTGTETGPATVPLGFSVNFFGTEYNSVYVNNNGNLTFDAPLSTFTPFGLESTNSVIIAPFFADVDTRVGNNVEFGTGTLGGHKVFVANWPSVGCFDENDSVTDDFQVILIDRSDRDTGALGDDFDIEFNYNSIQWDAGQASGGDANCQNAADANSAAVGFSNGTSTPGDSFELPGSQTSGAFLDSNTSTGLIFNDLNSSVLGQYLFTVHNGAPSTKAPTTLTTSLTGGGHSGTSISVPPSTAVTDQASLSGASASTATGTVTYDVYSNAACTALVSSGPSQAITTPGVVPGSNPVSLATSGTYYWQANYSGDSNNAQSSSLCGAAGEIETVATSGGTKTPDTVTLHFGSAPTYGPQSPVAPGTNEVLEATVNPNGITNPGSSVTAPSGTVTFLNGSTPLATVPVNASRGSGYAADSTTHLAAGSHEITAVYNGDSRYSTSTSNQVQITVTAGAKATATSTPTTVGLDFGSGPAGTEQSPVPLGSHEVFTATVSPNGIVEPGSSTPAPTGTVSFFDGTTLLGTVNVSAFMGSSFASFPTGGLPIGSHEITAVYNGDHNHPASTSNQVQVSVA
jgi:hypothetical protein